MTSSRENILIKRPDIVHNWRSGKSSSTLNRATKSSKAIVFSTHWNLVNMPCLVQPSFYSPHDLRWISSLNEKHTKFHGRCRCLSLHHFQRLLGRFFNDLSSAKLSSFFLGCSRRFRTIVDGRQRSRYQSLPRRIQACFFSRLHWPQWLDLHDWLLLAGCWRSLDVKNQKFGMEAKKQDVNTENERITFNAIY